MSVLNKRHPVYWLDDGNLILNVHHTAYNVHRSLLTRHSPVFATLAQSTDEGYTVSALRIPDELGVVSDDFDRLLEHLYHDMYMLARPVQSDGTLARLSSILRVTSEHQLNFPDIHKLARDTFQSLYPRTLRNLSHSQNADQALQLAVQYQMYPIQKVLFYTVATHLHFEEDNEEASVAKDSEADPALSPSATSLPPDIVRRCKALLDDVINHFTPILFTVATAGHMQCTDTLAETWMPLVIQPALENNGLCRPIETLQAIIDLDWGKHGLCMECVANKREEWKGEQEIVWNKLDDWLGLKDQSL